jgi:hypothetical protein
MPSKPGHSSMGQSLAVAAMHVEEADQRIRNLSREVTRLREQVRRAHALIKEGKDLLEDITDDPIADGWLVRADDWLSPGADA